MSSNQSLTSGQAAEYCRVSQATILNWIKEGKLRAYTTPGGHYRILQGDLVAFLEAYEMPVDPALRKAARPQVLIVGSGQGVASVAQALRESDRFAAQIADNGYEASAQVARLAPDAVVVDVTSEALDGPALCQWLRSSAQVEPLYIVAVGDREDGRSWLDRVDAFLPGDVAPEELESQVVSLLDRRGDD